VSFWWVGGTGARCTVVGEAERSSGTVNVRTRDNHVHGVVPLDEALKRLDRTRRLRLSGEEFSLD